MFFCKVNERTELRLLERGQSGELFRLLDSNRDYLRQWHPWVDALRTEGNVERVVEAWQRQFAEGRGLFAGVWFEGRLCGMVNYLSVDRANGWGVLSYWLDKADQGKGIMTACVRALVTHGFEAWKLHRVTVECATENTRSRAIPERLGFRLEGIVREVERLQDRFVDHAIYGLLATEDPPARDGG